MRMNERDCLVLVNIRLHVVEHVQDEAVDELLIFLVHSRPVGFGRLFAARAGRASNHLSWLNAKNMAQIDFTFLTSRNAFHFISLCLIEEEQEGLELVA